MTFIRSYLNHRPQFNPRASATPKMHPLESSSRNSISDFYLDSRTPAGSTVDLQSSNYNEEEAKREQETERQVQELLKEVRIWRVANSAQWVAWGIVQAVVPGLEDNQSEISKEEASSESIVSEAQETKENGDKASEADEEEEFDYLAYAQDRAMFFWGDVISLGIVDKAELPEELLKKVKIVEY